MKNSKQQKEVFLATEGDQWFSRNESKFSAAHPINEELTRKIASYCGNDDVVLEVGCSSGLNLEKINQLVAIRGEGIDPSARAVAEGSSNYPKLRIRQGTADQLPMDNATVDVVWFGFCLYLVDRTLLHTVVAEADRVLKGGGILVIHDFDPDFPRMRKYIHHNGLWSYKMDYSKLFLCNPAYALVEKQSFSHKDWNWTSDPQERCGLWIMKKNLENGYCKDEDDLI